VNNNGQEQHQDDAITTRKIVDECATGFGIVQNNTPKDSASLPAAFLLLLCVGLVHVAAAPRPTSANSQRRFLIWKFQTDGGQEKRRIPKFEEAGAGEVSAGTPSFPPFSFPSCRVAVNTNLPLVE
jgi:hypothetical protein